MIKRYVHIGKIELIDERVLLTIIWRQTINLVIIFVLPKPMQKILDIEVLIQSGSGIIPAIDYPFAACLMGFFVAKTRLSHQSIFTFVQMLYELKGQKHISELIFKQIVQLVEYFPQQFEEIAGTLKRIGKREDIDIVYWIQSHYYQINNKGRLKPEDQSKLNGIENEHQMKSINGIHKNHIQKSNHEQQHIHKSKNQHEHIISHKSKHQHEHIQSHKSKHQQEHIHSHKCNHQHEHGHSHHAYKPQPIKKSDTIDLTGQNSGTEQLQIQQSRQSKEQIQKRDIQIARRMQAQFDRQQTIVRSQNQQQEPCQICYVNLWDDQIETLDSCGHLFHKNCMMETFKTNIFNNTFPMRCPQENCQKEVTENDLRAILSPEMFDKYQSHTLKAYADQHGQSVSWCPTANCGYMFFYEKGDNNFACPQCKKEYCLNCRVQWHKDMTCKQYQVTHSMNDDDKAFLQFVQGKKYKQCPKCRFWVQKNQGCDHMTCKCKFQFCYKCGGVYGKCECAQLQRRQYQQRMREHRERAEQRRALRAEQTRKRKEQTRIKREEQRARKREEKERQKERKKQEKQRNKSAKR